MVGLVAVAGKLDNKEIATGWILCTCLYMCRRLVCSVHMRLPEKSQLLVR